VPQKFLKGKTTGGGVNVAIIGFGRGGGYGVVRGVGELGGAGGGLGEVGMIASFDSSLSAESSGYFG